MTVLRALVVEDRPDDAELLLRELTRGGYEVEWDRVDTAAAMRTALLTRRWDIVFSDWSMPHFSAPHALEVMKELALDLPFIITSGSIGEDVVIEALRSGAHDFFSKGRFTLLMPAVEREVREAAVRRERAQMQEQLMMADRLATAGMLAASVAHEINNPLAALIGNLDLALQNLRQPLQSSLSPKGANLPDDERQRLSVLLDEVNDAHEAADQIRSVVRDVKLFVYSGGDERESVDVHRVLESSLRMARNQIRHRGRVQTFFAPVPPVRANPSRLGQVFLNLLVNAAQSIPEGHTDDNDISVTTSVTSDGHVEVEVSDTGSGMTDEVRDRLFTPFFTTKPVGVGTGLGLSICQRIVQSLGGSIEVESKVGVGSVFRVRLVATEPAPGPVVAPSSTHGPTRRGAVLVIDDTTSVSVVITRGVGADHDVTTTANASEALSWIKDGSQYDVILCDLMMPHMSGMDFHRELLALDPQQAARVIYLTGGAFTAQAREFLDDIDNLYIEKPFDIIALRNLINDRI